MKVTPLEEVERRPRRVAVGEFDGVHLGHQKVIEGADTVLTFEPHPVQVIRPEAAPRLLTSLDVKAELIADLGVDELVVISFDEEFSHRSPESFVDDVLIGALDARHVSVGENFRFGHRAAGDIQLLRSREEFETRVAPLVECEGEIVSSSHIRGLLLAGDVETADRFLGHPFQMRGPVVEGDRRGRTLGFPTANVVPDEALIYPGHGVYAGFAEGAPAAINVGVRPTFDTGRGVLVEAYLIDFEGDLYGQELKLDFLARLRGERRFADAEALVEQMRTDVAQARAVCATARE